MRLKFVRCTLLFGGMRTGFIHQNSLVRLLIIGFGLVIVLLVIASFAAVRNVRAIQESSARVSAQQNLEGSLIEGLQREQKTLNAVFYRLARTPDAVDPEQTLNQLDRSAWELSELVRSTAGTPDGSTWQELEKATETFSDKVRLILDEDSPETFVSADLLLQHQQVISLTTKLLASGSERASAAQRRIQETSSQLLKESFASLGASLFLALVCAITTVRMATTLVQQMETQAAELTQVSWHMLQNQESIARRFSHELHDELGQSLTAIKANLVAVAGNSETERARLGDARSLVDEAIGNVRQMSQLLRPVILDDLGLDAALRTLCEGFTQRTGIACEYESNFEGRLSGDAETHLFRIAQEALTNIARHSDAQHASIGLTLSNGRLELGVSDNGKGLPIERNGSRGLGMVGMRARARSAGGEVHVTSEPGKGVQIYTWVPVDEGAMTLDGRATNDSNPIS